MGKKTLEEIGKILLVSIISILISVQATRRVLLDSKLDKTEYESDQKQRWDSHDKNQGLRDKRNEDMYDMVKYLYQEKRKENNK